MTFTPSKYQQAVFDFIEHGAGHGVVEAIAGSGKTTTLVEAARRLRVPNSVFLAFNRHIADELNARLAGTGMAAKTFHSVGNAMLARHIGKAQIDDRKYRRLVKAHFERKRLPSDDEADIISTAGKLVNLARVTLTPGDDAVALEALCRHHDLTPFDEALDAIPALLWQGQERAQIYREIDFTDMIYLPLVWGLQPAKLDWVFVDEAQDLNAMQLEIALRLCAPGGRMLFIGDRRQAIYGFAGADAYSFQRIIDVTKATVLPLSICYRCPTSHLDLARRIVPQIEARDGAPQGNIVYAAETELPKLVQEGDLVLCRLTAPLVAWCIRLIQQRVPARVRGRDIGRDLCAILEKLERSIVPFDYAELPRYLREYQLEQVEFLVKKDADESQIQSLIDRVECLHVCAANFGEARSVAALCDAINGLFSDERSAVWLSTVHKAKGLENDRVILLQPEKLPLVWQKQQEWQYEQELNLKYVALTRARQTLIILGLAEPNIADAPVQMPLELAVAEVTPVSEAPAPRFHCTGRLSEDWPAWMEWRRRSGDLAGQAETEAAR